MFGLVFATALFAAAAMARDKDTLVVVQEAEPVGLDIMQSSIQTTMSVGYNLHDTILKPQEDATVKPGMVEKWEKVDDLTWKFTLVKGATFHNGEPINAAAVKFSFDRLMSDALKSRTRANSRASKGSRSSTSGPSRCRPPSPTRRPLHARAILVRGPAEYVKKVGDAEYNLNPWGPALQAGQVGQGQRSP